MNLETPSQGNNSRSNDDPFPRDPSSVSGWKIYWRDPEGKSPPRGASFRCRPFFKEAPTPSFNCATRVENLPPPSKPIRLLHKNFLPAKSEWISSVVNTTDAIETQAFEKVVLARCCTLECETVPDPFAITAHLETKAKNATVFCFANEKMAFLGATPELLFSRKGNAIQSEALAGTRPRGKTAIEDLKNEHELLQNQKTRKEIVPVQKFLTQKLSPLCIEPPSFSPIYVRKTQNVQHLCSKTQGILRQNITDAKILDQIHPTPALCGAPTENAFNWIHEHEPFDRSLYGSAIGWSTPEESVWIVAIRCCLIKNTTVQLYTGVGIVQGSDPEEEWEELNAKMNLYQGIFL